MNTNLEQEPLRENRHKKTTQDDMRSFCFIDTELQIHFWAYTFTALEFRKKSELLVLFISLLVKLILLENQITDIRQKVKIS